MIAMLRPTVAIGLYHRYIYSNNYIYIYGLYATNMQIISILITV
jgi:hypothetical protein